MKGVPLLAEMAKQASLGHKRFCVGIHEHEGGELEYEWIDWTDAFASLKADLLTAEEAEHIQLGRYNVRAAFFGTSTNPHDNSIFAKCARAYCRFSQSDTPA